MRSHGLRQLVDDKSVASCQQTCYKLVNLTGLLQIVSASCNKSANDIATSLILTGFCNLTKLTSLLQLVDKLKQASKTDNLQIVRGVFGCVRRVRTMKINNQEHFTVLVQRIL